MVAKEFFYLVVYFVFTVALCRQFFYIKILFHLGLRETVAWIEDLPNISPRNYCLSLYETETVSWQAVQKFSSKQNITKLKSSTETLTHVSHLCWSTTAHTARTEVGHWLVDTTRVGVSFRDVPMSSCMVSHSVYTRAWSTCPSWLLLVHLLQNVVSYLRRDYAEGHQDQSFWWHRHATSFNTWVMVYFLFQTLSPVCLY